MKRRQFNQALAAAGALPPPRPFQSSARRRGNPGWRAAAPLGRAGRHRPGLPPRRAGRGRRAARARPAGAGRHERRYRVERRRRALARTACRRRGCQRSCPPALRGSAPARRVRRRTTAAPGSARPSGFARRSSRRGADRHAEELDRAQPGGEVLLLVDVEQALVEPARLVHQVEGRRARGSRENQERRCLSRPARRPASKRLIRRSPAGGRHGPARVRRNVDSRPDAAPLRRGRGRSWRRLTLPDLAREGERAASIVLREPARPPRRATACARRRSGRAPSRACRTSSPSQFPAVNGSATKSSSHSSSRIPKKAGLRPHVRKTRPPSPSIATGRVQAARRAAVEQAPSSSR